MPRRPTFARVARPCLPMAHLNLPVPWPRPRALASITSLLLCATALAEEPGVLPAVTVTDTAASRPIGLQQLPVPTGAALGSAASLAGVLGEVPGLLVRDRSNQAQDVQVSARGFGARSTFGIRGLRLTLDGIPLTGADGQTQVSGVPLRAVTSIDLLSAPWALLQGAAPGGWLGLRTDLPEAEPGSVLTLDSRTGPDGDLSLALLSRGRQHGLDHLLSLDHVRSDGWRPQSAHRRATAYARLGRREGQASWMLSFNHSEGRAEDPLGLSAGELAEGARTGSAAALRFNTRKATAQTQLGWRQTVPLGAGARVEWLVHGGRRSVQQVLAIPPAAQLAPTSPGGYIDLNRHYGGAELHWQDSAERSGTGLRRGLSVSLDVQDEHRQGRENAVGDTLGVPGRLRRDEHNRAVGTSVLGWLEARNDHTRAMLALRGLDTRYRSRDAYVTAGNPDDSGTARFRAWLPMVGVHHELGPGWQAHAAVGRGEDIPTLNEMAYRLDGAAGLNTAVSASASTTTELGLHYRAAGQRLAVRLFNVQSDDEILQATSTGGRASFRNAGATRRTGVELQHEWARGSWRHAVSTTWMSARLARNDLPATRLPGVPAASLHARVGWTPLRGQAGEWLAELTATSRMQANDANTASAPGHAVLHLGWHKRWQRGPWALTPHLRIDNALNRRYVGSVIVNESNGRHFEPGRPRAWGVGVTVQRSLDDPS